MSTVISVIELVLAFILGSHMTASLIKPAEVRVSLHSEADVWEKLADMMRARADAARFTASMAGAGFNILNSWNVKDQGAAFVVNMTLDTDAFAAAPMAEGSE